MSVFSVEKWSKFHIDDLYHPKYQECLGWFMEVTFGLSCLFYGFTSYIILTKSPKQMGAFKYTVFTQLTFNMLYKALMFIYNPVFHFPIIAVSFNRSFSFSMLDTTIFFGTTFLVIITAAFAMLFSVITRLVAAFSTNSSTKSRISIRFGAPAACGLTMFVWVSICIPLFLMCTSIDDSWITLAETVPALSEIKKVLSNTFVINPNLVMHLFTPFAAAACFWMLTYAVAFITCNIIFVIQLQKIKKLVSSTTFALQKMLHTSLIIQTFNMFIFCLFPCSIIFYALIFQLSYGSWIVNIQIAFSSLHLIVDAPLLIYSVKPYRNYVLKLFIKRRHTVLVIEQPSFTQIK